jgi:hypothetical protein
MPWWQIQELMLTTAGILVVLIPVTGLTLRFAIKPFLKDIAGARAGRQVQPGVRDAEQDSRLGRIENQLDSLETSVRQLTEVVQFDRQLKSPQREPGQQGEK